MTSWKRCKQGSPSLRLPLLESEVVCVCVVDDMWERDGGRRDQERSKLMDGEKAQSRRTKCTAMELMICEQSQEVDGGRPDRADDLA